jgi:dipeptidase E
MVINRQETIVGLRESTLLQVEGEKIELMGARPMRVFQFGREPQEFEPGSDINFLLV